MYTMTSLYHSLQGLAFLVAFLSIVFPDDLQFRPLQCLMFNALSPDDRPPIA